MLTRRTGRAVRQGSRLCSALVAAATGHCARITTSSASPETEPKPATLDAASHGKRRRPLTAEQRKFLDSAVRLS